MKQLKRWLPALLMMVIIFGFSATPSNELPNFGGLDFSVKKLGHAVGYALLAILYWRALNQYNQDGSRGAFVARHAFAFAWLLAVAYAGTDEFHQMFVPGRHASVWDILIFDNFGAFVGLLANHVLRKKA